MIAVSSGGAIAGPSEEAALNRPSGTPRSLIGNQFTEARAPAVNIGDSPAPRPARANRNWLKLCTVPEIICAIDQNTMPAVSMMCGPMRSVIGADRQLEDGVGPGEGGQQRAHLPGRREVHLVGDRVVGDGERRAVDVIHHAGRDKQRDHDPLAPARLGRQAVGATGASTQLARAVNASAAQQPRGGRGKPARLDLMRAAPGRATASSRQASTRNTSRPAWKHAAPSGDRVERPDQTPAPTAIADERHAVAERRAGRRPGGAGAIG